EEALGYCLYAHHRSCGSCNSTAGTRRQQRHLGLGLASPQFSSGLPLSNVSAIQKLYTVQNLYMVRQLKKARVKNNESPSDGAFVSPAEKLSGWRCTSSLRSQSAFR